MQSTEHRRHSLILVRGTSNVTAVQCSTALCVTNNKYIDSGTKRSKRKLAESLLINHNRISVKKFGTDRRRADGRTTLLYAFRYRCGHVRNDKDKDDDSAGSSSAILASSQCLQ